MVAVLVSSCGGGEDDGAAGDTADGQTTTTVAGAVDQPANAALVLPPNNTWTATAGPPRVQVFGEPDEATEPVELLSNPNEIGAPLTFLVDGTEVGGEFIPVFLPIPPNGTRGWVRTRDVSLKANPYHIKVEVGAHRLTLTNAGETVLETPVGVGRDGRETPTGLYYLKELRQPPDPNGIYGPYAYGISGFTTSPEAAAEFGDGGVIGIHGTNEPSSIGRDVSSGCIRVPNDIITEMAEYLPLGTPVEIVA